MLVIDEQGEEGVLTGGQAHRRRLERVAPLIPSIVATPIMPWVVESTLRCQWP